MVARQFSGGGQAHSPVSRPVGTLDSLTPFKALRTAQETTPRNVIPVFRDQGTPSRFSSPIARKIPGSRLGYPEKGSPLILIRSTEASFRALAKWMRKCNFKRAWVSKSEFGNQRKTPSSPECADRNVCTTLMSLRTRAFHPWKCFAIPVRIHIMEILSAGRLVLE